MASKLFVTGAAGFIGSKVCQFLLADGHAVVGVDNLNDAYDVRLKEWRLKQLLDNPDFEFHRMDITDRQNLTSLWHLSLADSKSPFDAVVNMAARAGVRQSVENPWVYYETNVMGTLNLLELCKEFGVRKFVLASSSSLYGASRSIPFREDADTDQPLSPYAASKKAAETLCYSYHYLHGIDTIVLRYFTVYGPAGRPDMSLFRFVQWIHEGRPVIVFGDGHQSRDFTYVEDIARGTLAALRVPGYEIINLGSDCPVVLMDAIRLIEQFAGREAVMEYRPCHPADVLATWADTHKAQQLLGWRPQCVFQDGLKQLVAWYQANQEWASRIQV